MNADNPFKNYYDLLSPERLRTVETNAELIHAANQINFIYEKLIADGNLEFENSIREFLAERADMQSQRLENFLLIAFGLIVAIAMFVFLPVDIFLRNILGKLSLEQERAKNAMKHAENADRAKSEFLANMSHEIRTPMNGVMGMAELLAKTELNAKQRTFTDIIVKSGASLLTIINDILDFSKIDAGQMELDPAPFNIADAIEDVATLVSSRVAEKDLELIVRVDPNLPQMLVGDVGRIRQIITNMLGNAVKFTERGHVFVEVTGTQLVEDDGSKPDNSAQRYSLKFKVEDTGSGIPEEKCAKVFEKFSQVDTTTTRKHEGTGLGLAISSSLVKLMGGEIGVDSELGKGSTFWFTIELPMHERSEKARVVPGDVNGSRILIIDDNEVNRQILIEQMTSWRLDSAAAVNGEEGLAVMRAACAKDINIDAVILDYHMPGMNGADVVRAMKADSELAKLPIIMLTSVEQTDEGKTFSSLGVHGHLTKPARSSLLLETIIQVISDEKARKATNVNGHLEGIHIAQQIGRGDTVKSLDTVDAEETVVSKDVSEQQSDADAAVGSAGALEVPHNVTEELFSDFVSEPELEIVENVDEPKQPSAPVGPVNADNRHVDIIVCEDNEVNQIVFTQILQLTDFSFQIASNGEEGLALYKSLKPKLILMDVSMPLMNGLDATKAIRKIEAKTGTHTPIIGVTAHAIKGDKEKFLEAGMDDYLSKPISPDVLTAKIMRTFEKSEYAAKVKQERGAVSRVWAEVSTY